MSKNIQSNVFEIRKGLEEVGSTFRGLGKKYDESATTMKAYADKTNVGIFNDLSNILTGFKENQINQIVSLNETSLEAAVTAHKKMNNVASSLDV